MNYEPSEELKMLRAKVAVTRASLEAIEDQIDRRLARIALMLRELRELG